MQSDPALSKYSHVILDEIHERDIMCDFVLTILKDIISKVRKSSLFGKETYVEIICLLNCSYYNLYDRELI